MADVGILFQPPMVRAIDEDRKLVTRRLPGKLKGFTKVGGFTRSKTPGQDWCFRDKFGSWHNVTHAGLLAILPWKKGDRLWVREAWAEVGSFDPGLIVWRASYPACVPKAFENVTPIGDIKWTPGIHMPRKHSRFTLTVSEEVRVERLQDITEEDAMLEGASSRPNCSGIGNRDRGWSMDWSRVGAPSRWASDGKILSERDVALVNARQAFGNYFCLLNGEEVWKANPFVCRIAFTVEKRNIDA